MIPDPPPRHYFIRRQNGQWYCGHYKREGGRTRRFGRYLCNEQMKDFLDEQLSRFQDDPSAPARPRQLPRPRRRCRSKALFERKGHRAALDADAVEHSDGAEASGKGSKR